MSTATMTSGPSLIGTSGDSLREAFGKALVELAPEFPKAIVLDADIAGGRDRDKGLRCRAKDSRERHSA